MKKSESGRRSLGNRARHERPSRPITDLAVGRGARLLSIVLHPFVVFAALALIAAWRLNPTSFNRTALGVAISIAIVGVFIWQRRRGGHWQTIDASQRSERPLLYLVVLLVALGYWRWIGGGSSVASSGVLATIAMLCVAAIANRWIKLSLHLASLAFAGVVLLRVDWPAGAIALSLVPVLAWARVRMRRHTIVEVIAGGTLGVLCGLAVLSA